MKNCDGAILVIALLYLLITTLLILSAMEAGILTTKLSANFNKKIMAFENAESLLVIASSSISFNQAKGQSALSGLGSYNYEQVLQLSRCQKEYKITVVGVYKDAKSYLESRYLLPNTQAQECAYVHKQRLEWSEGYSSK